jgi:NTP pyrophosphatase (non-canonical NTP hydrolase)
MTIREYQDKVDNWINTIGVRYFDEKTNTILLMEELGELSRLIARKYGEQSFKQPLKEIKLEKKISDEMADILFVISCLANQMNIDLTEAIKLNFEKKTRRDKTRHTNNDKLN